MLILEKSPMELKSIIGKRKTESGETVRMNKIALAELKYILSNKTCVDKKTLVEYYFGGVYNNDSLIRRVMQNHLMRIGEINLEGIGLSFSVPNYRTDHLHGLCEDGDTNCIRLVKYDGESEKVIKKKIGKVVAEALENTLVCEQARTFVCEHVAQKWKAYATEKSVDQSYHLVVDGDFDAIYDRGMQIGDFHSCMNGCHGIEFYSEIDAYAASLRDEDNMIVARCVVFNDVHDTDGGVHKYAERQYSSNQNLTLQQILVNKLYDEGYIDLNKRVGASCWDSNDVVDRNGNVFVPTLYIEHCFDDGDACPFMDGFAYYDSSDERLYNNSSACRYYDKLHKTEGYYGDFRTCEVCGRRMSEDCAFWSEYLEMDLCEDCACLSETLGSYIRSDRAVEVLDHNGRFDSYMPEDYDGDDHTFVEIDGDYYWMNDCVWDNINDEYVLVKNSVDYNYFSRGKWYTECTNEDEVGSSIVEFDDEYWLVDDCVDVDGVWYPKDQVPEKEVEENVEC